MPYECAICVPLLRAKEETLWLAKLDRSSHEATADGLSESISAATTKRRSAITTTEPSAARCAGSASIFDRLRSLQDLEKATGVNKSGLYTEFADKRNLYLESLRYYLRKRQKEELQGCEKESYSVV